MTTDEMIQQQIERRGIKDPKVLAAMHKVERRSFVPPNLLSEAYDDGPLPIGHHQTISQPYIVAFMTDALHLTHEDRVLEIGTGSGYQTAILAEIAKEIFTIELVETLYRTSRERLLKMGYSQIRFRYGDGNWGWPEEAPFDKIIVTAASDKIPEALIAQLRDNGIMIIPIGDHTTQTLILGVKQHGYFQTTETIAVRFVPLVQKK